MGTHAPWVSHFLFADDYLVFTHAIERGGRRLVDILRLYQKGLGHMVNFAKSAIFFGPNCVDTVKEEMRQTTRIGIEAPSEKYLGFPTKVGHSTTEAFKPIPRSGGWLE